MPLCTSSYDTAGNILSAKTYAYTTGALGTPLSEDVYAYTDANWSDKLTSYNGVSFTYDAQGNPLTYYNGENYTFTWQNGRQLASATKGTTNVTYKYNSDGIRYEKTVNGVVHKYYLNGSTITAETIVDNGNVTYIEYFYDTLGAHSFSLNGTMYFYIKNLQGDVMHIATADNTIVASYTYDAWGNIESVTGTLANTVGAINPIRYRGYYYDNETGLYYVSSRYYDPEIGRWINADAAIGQIGNVQGTNMFAYCFNNPVNMSDPTGNWPKLSTIFKVVAVAAAVVAVAAVCVATAGLATVAVAGGGTMLAATATTTAALGVAATAGKVTLAATGAAAVSEIAEETYDDLPRNHTVYGLKDLSTGEIEYVGRTTDPAKRAAAHKRNTARKHLEMVPLATGLNEIEARGVEQIQMLAHHTINTANKMNNQINGISPINKKIGVYMKAARGALAYLENQISNEILYWTGN